MSSTKTLEEMASNLKRNGALDFRKDLHGAHLISFSCVEKNGSRYAYFHDCGKVVRHRDTTDEAISTLE